MISSAQLSEAQASRIFSSSLRVMMVAEIFITFAKLVGQTFLSVLHAVLNVATMMDRQECLSYKFRNLTDHVAKSKGHGMPCPYDLRVHGNANC
jgi:hypothetical protein